MQVVHRSYIVSAFRLFLEWMQLTIVHEHWLGLVLAVMWHRVEPLGVVETDDHEGASSHEMLLEWRLLHVGQSECALACKHCVFVCVELFFNISSEHF